MIFAVTWADVVNQFLKHYYAVCIADVNVKGTGGNFLKTRLKYSYFTDFVRGTIHYWHILLKLNSSPLRDFSGSQQSPELANVNFQLLSNDSMLTGQMLYLEDLRFPRLRFFMPRNATISPAMLRSELILTLVHCFFHFLTLALSPHGFQQILSLSLTFIFIILESCQNSRDS